MQPSSEVKRLLREQVLARRARLAPGEREARSRAIAERLEQIEAFRRARTVALYAPLGTEVDTAEVERRARAAGKTVAWPRLASGSRHLEFAACGRQDLVPGPVGALEPPASATVLAPASVDCVLAPGLAFDGAGGRLGRGGGHYDATLALLPRAARIGLAFEAQIVPSVPLEPHDARLDAVVTEDRVLAGPPR